MFAVDMRCQLYGTTPELPLSPPRPMCVHANRTNAQLGTQMHIPPLTPRSLAQSADNADEYEYNAFLTGWWVMLLLLNDDASMSLPATIFRTQRLLASR